MRLGIVGNSHHGGLDHNARLAAGGVFPPPFQPGDVLAKVAHSWEVITFRIVRPVDVPVAKTLRRGGFTMVDAVPVTHEHTAAAIRAERDSR